MQSINLIFPFFLISCRRFNKLTENKLVLQQIKLTPYFNHPALLHDKKKKKIQIFSCYGAKNPDALLIVGSYKYFLNEQVDEGKKLIEKTLPCPNFIAAYIHGIMLLCESCKVVIYNYVLCWLYSMTKSVVIVLIYILVLCGILLYWV